MKYITKSELIQSVIGVLVYGLFAWAIAVAFAEWGICVRTVLALSIWIIGKFLVGLIATNRERRESAEKDTERTN